MRRCALFLVSLLATSMPVVAHARTVTAAELKSLQTPLKSILATQKAAMKAERAIWLAAVAEYETSLKTIGASDSALANLCEKTGTFVGAIRHAARMATIEAAMELPSLLSPLGPAAATDPLVTKAKGQGAGGAFDAFRTKVAKCESKELAFVASRLKRIAKKAEKAGLAVSAVVVTAARATHVAISFSSSSWYANVEPSIDLLLAWSHVDVEGDGRLFVAGSAPMTLGTVGISVSMQPADDKFATIDQSTQRWSELFLTGIVEEATRVGLLTGNGPLFVFGGIEVR
jgi:hypothetical protein